MLQFTQSHTFSKVHEVIIIAFAFFQPCPPKPLVPKPSRAYPNQVPRIDKFNAGKPKCNVYKNHPLRLEFINPQSSCFFFFT